MTAHDPSAVPTASDILAAREGAKRLLAWLRSLSLGAKHPGHRDAEGQQQAVAVTIANGDAALKNAETIDRWKRWLARESPVDMAGMMAASYHEALWHLAVAIRHEIADTLREAYFDAQPVGARGKPPPITVGALWTDESWESVLGVLRSVPGLGRRECHAIEAELDCEQHAAIRRVGDHHACRTTGNDLNNPIISPSCPIPPHVSEGKASAKPRWDATSRQLWLGAQLLRTYSRRAPSQFTVLDAFEAAGWPTSIPVPPRFNAVKDTVEALNDSLSIKRLRFHRGAGDASIYWNLTPV